MFIRLFCFMYFEHFFLILLLKIKLERGFVYIGLYILVMFSYTDLTQMQCNEILQ